MWFVGSEKPCIYSVPNRKQSYRNASVWNASGNIYYADGKKVPFSVKQTKLLDAKKIREQLDELSPQNSYDFFNENINKFLVANRRLYDYITNEAMEYIRTMAEGVSLTEMFVSFSGGKDSTVVSDLVLRALGNQQVLHLYGDTTLEFPESAKYVKRFKAEHPKTLVITAKNKDKNFEELCEQLGPPSRVMRWCCTFLRPVRSRERFRRCLKIRRESLRSTVSEGVSQIPEINTTENRTARRLQYKGQFLRSLTGWTLMYGCIF